MVDRCDQNDHIDSEKRTCERIAVEHRTLYGYASKAEMLRIDMALLVSLALNVLSGNRSE